MSLIMLSYQHAYHAGNYADVLKHAVLTYILGYMQHKDAAFFYLETHAGRGLYDLNGPMAQKTREYQAGITQIWQKRTQCPAAFAEYLNIVSSLNAEDGLRYYPGSPRIAQHFLRPQDRMMAFELHPREFELLSSLPKSGKKTHYKASDGLQALRSELPPLEKRAVICIDPSYEVKDDYKTIPNTLEQALQRFAQGVYLLWYPIIDMHQHARWVRRLEALNTSKTLRVESYLAKPPLQGMLGHGLWIINPPYTLTKDVASLLDWLEPLLGMNSEARVISYQEKP